MKLKLIAAGNKMPSWVQLGVEEYSKRLPREFELSVVETPLGARSKTSSISQAIAKEGEAMLRSVDKNDYLIALDVKGKMLTTEAMAEQVSRIKDQGFNLSMLIGGPDGLSEDCLSAARQTWSLSALTFPHPIVRVVVAEQIYRVWSFLNNHPYHRAG